MSLPGKENRARFFFGIPPGRSIPSARDAFPRCAAPVFARWYSGLRATVILCHAPRTVAVDASTLCAGTLA